MFRGAFSALLVLGYVGLVSLDQGRASDPALPDRALTPGAVSTTDLALICKPGYARAARRTAVAVKQAVYAAYRIAPESGRYEIDHLIPLELGGADVIANLWPERHDGNSGDSTAKDRLENYLHREVCAGRISLSRAQLEIAANWLAAYRKYFAN